MQQKDPTLEKLIPERLHWIEQQKMNPTGLPMFDKGKPVMEKVLFPSLYNVHVDLSKRRDATGLVIAHNVGAVKVPRMDPKSMQLVEESKPVMRVDLVLRIIAPKNGEVDIPRLRAILYELNRVYKDAIRADYFRHLPVARERENAEGRGLQCGHPIDGQGHDALRNAAHSAL